MHVYMSEFESLKIKCLCDDILMYVFYNVIIEISSQIPFMWRQFVCFQRRSAKSKGFSNFEQIEACVFPLGWTDICLVLLRLGKKNERFGSAEPPLGKG